MTNSARTLVLLGDSILDNAPEHIGLLDRPVSRSADVLRELLTIADEFGER